MGKSVRKRIGLLGGSFDPVHLGHLHLANELYKRWNLKEIWWIPAYVSPHKIDTPAISVRHRLEMIQLAIGDIPYYKTLDIECMQEGPSYTVDTLRILTNRYPEVDFFLLLGSDTVERFHDWKEPEEIVRLCGLVIASREKKKPFISGGDQVLLKAVERGWTEIPLLEVSSTEIRTLIKEGKDFTGLLPEKVISYIQEHSLYV